ncbi:uncharacterized protein N7458_010103 [Penicillium daleae]|uniref:Uncharacterized protein n=1 Tax=Penicillium daleae TaxID=63821 RepID=A0AAD6FZ11_9EURO|nr:uncharacterized protein N7458_010103 [Penicillium daleae]KAJ5439105.1 hypothetical protein N7458_010103 [Penicillium daleae]
MYFSLIVMSASLAAAVLAVPVAEENTQVKRAPVPAKEILIKVVADADVGLKKRDTAPNEPTEDDINVNLGAGVGVTKRDASPEDLVSISVGADRSVHIGKRMAAAPVDDGVIGVGLGRT